MHDEKTTSHDAGREAVDWTAPIEAVHDDGRVVAMNVVQLSAGVYADNDHWLATADGTRFPGAPGSSWGNWARKDGKLNGQPGWRIRNVAAASSEGSEQTYESDERRLFCRHCGRSHIRHFYKAGIGFLCDPDLSIATRPPAQAGAASVECGAKPDHADIMETIQNASDTWQKDGYTSALAEVRDMANVGRALMEALPKGYCYMDCPSEIVSDLQNELEEARATPAALGEIPGGMVETGREGCIGSMNPMRATYFLDRFKREEKLLGPHEQWALDYTIGILAALSTPKASAETGDLPAVMPGHWTTPVGRDMALATLDDPHMAQSRERISDFALANEVFLSPGIANLTNAKERIRWLSATLAALSAAPSAPATEAGEEVDVNFEVWEDDMMVAGSTSEADARHYHVLYSQDGPVSLQKAVTVRTVLIPATPTDQVKDEMTDLTGFDRKSGQNGKGA